MQIASLCQSLFSRENREKILQTAVYYVIEKANWSGSALFVITYVNFYQQPKSNSLIGWEW